MRRISKYLLVAALLGASATSTYASLRGGKESAASQEEAAGKAAAYRSYTASVPLLKTGGGAASFSGQMHPRPNIEARADPRAAPYDDEDNIDMPRKLGSGASGKDLFLYVSLFQFASESPPPPCSFLFSRSCTGVAALMRPKMPDPRAVPDDDEYIDMPRMLSAGTAGLLTPHRSNNNQAQAVVAEEDDYGIDMPRKLAGA